MSAAAAASLSRQDAPRRIRWRAALVILLLGTILAVLSRWLVPDDAAARMLSTASAIALTCVCLALWFVFFSGVSSRVRGATAAAMLATLVMLVAAFRISDLSGGFVPHLVWRAHHRPDGAVPAPLPPAVRWLAEHAATLFPVMAALVFSAWLFAFLRRGGVLRWLPAAMLVALAALANLAAAKAWHRPAGPLAALSGHTPHQNQARAAGERASRPSTPHHSEHDGTAQTASGKTSKAHNGPAHKGTAHEGSEQPPARGDAQSPPTKHVQHPAPAKAIDVTPVPCGPHDFPQFLGPDRNGCLRGRNLARDWTAQPPRLLWKQPIGPGWSSFAVVADYAVTQQQLDEMELIVCYSLKSGKVLWSHGNRVRFSSVIAGDGPRATPTIADGRVFALGSTGILNALALTDGTPLWETDILADHAAQPLQWGQSGSPLVVDGLVVVNPGGPRGHSLAAYDAATGQPRWHAGDDAASYASPMLATQAGRPQIVMVNQYSVTGHDPSTGGLLWTYPPTEQKAHTWLAPDPKVPQPLVVSADRLLIAAGYGLGCMLLELTPGAAEHRKVRELWDGFNRQLKPKFTNLVLHEGYVYGLDDGTALVCLDVESGARRWKQGRYGHGQILLVDDLLLVQSDTGRVALVEASPEGYRELGSFQAVEGKTWNTPALAGRLLLIRNDREAACFELPAQ